MKIFHPAEPIGWITHLTHDKMSESKQHLTIDCGATVLCGTRLNTEHYIEYSGDAGDGRCKRCEKAEEKRGNDAVLAAQAEARKPPQKTEAELHYDHKRALRRAKHIAVWLKCRPDVGQLGYGDEARYYRFDENNEQLEVRPMEPKWVYLANGEDYCLVNIIDGIEYYAPNDENYPIRCKQGDLEHDTDFYEMDDFEHEDSDYKMVVRDGKMMCKFEAENHTDDAESPRHLDRDEPDEDE